MEETKVIIDDFNTTDYAREYEGRDATYAHLVFMGGRKRESLNGLWHYAIDQYDCCINQHWWQERHYSDEGYTLPLDYSMDGWPVMKLPCSWNMADEKLFLYESTMIFTRTFSYVPNGKEKVFLRIGAANYICRVFLNQQYVGMHSGGSTPFMMDVTDYLGMYQMSAAELAALIMSDVFHNTQITGKRNVYPGISAAPEYLFTVRRNIWS